MPAFSALSLELVELILIHLEQPSLYAFAQVSRASYKITIPFLYRNVDLTIPSGSYIPHIDRFAINVLKDPIFAHHVQSLRLGLSHEEGVWDGPRYLPTKNTAGLDLDFQQAMQYLEQECLTSYAEDLRQGIMARDYGAYAALLILSLPALRCLEISDHHHETLRPLQALLRHEYGRQNLTLAEAYREEDKRSLEAHLASVEEVYYNVHRKSGTQLDDETNYVNLQGMLHFQNIRKLEFTIPRTRWRQILAPQVRPFHHGGVINDTLRPTMVRTMVIRHATHIVHCLPGLLSGTSNLSSLTCELFYDVSRVYVDINVPWISLDEWTTALSQVRATLKTLVLSVEFCDTEKSFFQQPDIRGNIIGRLDLRDFRQLITLEAPAPFISGDPGFSVLVDFDPYLPHNLRHLILRSDMSRAQFVYPFDVSVMQQGPTYVEAREETLYQMGARMDVASLASCSCFLAEKLPQLKSMTVWQPPDPTMAYFDSEIDNLAHICKRNSTSLHVLYPLMMPWLASSCWNLIKDIMMYDSSYPVRDKFSRLHRQERFDIPIGLASQYHLGEFRKRHVRRFKPSRVTT